MPDDVMERSAKLLDGITPEPWTIRYSEKGIVAVVNEKIKFFIAVLHPDDVGTDIGSANVAFIAAAPDLVRELRAKVEKLRAAPFRCQTHKCGWCGGCKAAGIDDENENLRAAIDRVRKLHICTQPIRGTIDDPYVHPCDSCGERLPCATIRALDGEA